MRRALSIAVSLGVLLTTSSIHAATSPVLYFDDQTHFEREIAPGEIHAYSIALKAGEYVRFAAMPDGIDIRLAIESPAGNQISHVDQTGTADPEVMSVIAETDGRYRLLVSTKSAQIGAYEARIEERRSALPQDRDRLEAEKLFTEGTVLIDDEKADSLANAVDRLTRAAALWRGVHDDAGVSDALNDLGIAHILLGRPSQALDDLGRRSRFANVLATDRARLCCITS